MSIVEQGGAGVRVEQRPQDHWQIERLVHVYAEANCRQRREGIARIAQRTLEHSLHLLTDCDMATIRGALSHPAVLILEMRHPMERELLCADGCSQHSNHHPVPILPAHWGLQQAKSCLEGVERDDGVLVLLLFGP